MPSDRLEQIRQFAQEVAVREGCLLYDLEFHDGPSRILRVYIDKDNDRGSVSIEDCANVSRALNLRLDVEDVIPGGRYDLEVSSPGMDRKLTQLWHFERAIEQMVRVKYTDPEGGIKTYEGKLTGVSGEVLHFENSKGPWTLDFSKVKGARVLLADVFGKKPAPGKKKR